MIDCLLDGLIDTLKLIPYLLITFIILELIEHKITKKTQATISKYKQTGPIIGGLLGGFPQCGFSAMASNLYTNKVITRGTIIAMFLSTSDEMLPIMLGEDVEIALIAKIIFIKVLIGIIVGLIVDKIFKSKIDSNSIKEMCDEEHCHCKKGIFISSIIHTLKTTLFVLIANLIINVLIYFIGVENLSNVLNNNNILVYFISSIIGLIPNCASSIVITEAYISGIIPLGVTIAGLLTGSGIGILLLFKNNKDLKDNIMILSITYFTGVIVGFIIDLFIH